MKKTKLLSRNFINRVHENTFGREITISNVFSFYLCVFSTDQELIILPQLCSNFKFLYAFKFCASLAVPFIVCSFYLYVFNTDEELIILA